MAFDGRITGADLRIDIWAAGRNGGVGRGAAGKKWGMITAGIKELRNQLSRYIGYVKRGDDVLITERGKVIARVVKENSPRTLLRQALQPLLLKGQITMPRQEIDHDVPEPLLLPGKSMSKIIFENRR